MKGAVSVCTSPSAWKRWIDDERLERNNPILCFALTERETLPGHPGHQRNFGRHAVADRALHRLLLGIGHPRWQSVITPALMYEYEDVARRPGNAPGLAQEEITNILDLIYQQSHRQLVWFSWRPLSPDPGDDAILEAAIAGGYDYVVSFILDKVGYDGCFVQCLQGFRDFKKPLPGSCAKWSARGIIKG